MKLRICEREPLDLDTAFKHAVRLEALTKEVDGYLVHRRNRPPRDGVLARRVADLERVTTVANPDSGVRQNPRQRDDEVSSLKKQLEEATKKLGWLEAVQAARAVIWTPPMERSPAPVVANQRPQTQPAWDQRSIQCYNCRGHGYLSRDCP